MDHLPQKQSMAGGQNEIAHEAPTADPHPRAKAIKADLGVVLTEVLTGVKPVDIEPLLAIVGQLNGRPAPSRRRIVAAISRIYGDA